jgi:hypothetical protein
VFNSVTGNQGGLGYELVAGSGTALQTVSNSFNIYDCMPSSGGTCSTPQVVNGDGSAGYQVSGSGLTTGFDVSFASTSPGASICKQYWNWSEMQYPLPGGGTGNFEGITTTSTSYQNSTGYQLVTLYFLNSLYVQTTASQTNSIQICAGAMHTAYNNDGTDPWIGANGTQAKWDGTNYWGVLQRIPNCNSNKVPVYTASDGNKVYSPALCAWGTVTINGVDYRSATMIVPYDWDFQPKG